ncbi:MAG: hypothetical protein L6R37_005174 [Teloschistes peruensis]|nr:MAG: hypothetical protein L6R37_005174 [Teloschistes peruensis]
MALRVTRCAAAREASLLASGGRDAAQQQESDKRTVPAPSPAVGKPASKKSSTARKATRSKSTNQTSAAAVRASVPGTEKGDTPAKAPATGKRKRSAAPKKEEDPNELPHGLGKHWKPSATQPSEEGANVLGPTGQEIVSEADTSMKSEAVDNNIEPDQRNMKDGPVENKQNTKDTIAEAGKNLASATANPKGKPEAKSRKKKVNTKTYDPASVVDPMSVSAATAAAEPTDPPKKNARKKNTNPYGLNPGVTPYPNWAHPTPEECQTVNDLLSSVHGHVAPPEKIPAPSLTVAGCGEVPCVLDAMIRTYLSSSTSGDNSSRAIQGIIQEYGLQTEGLGKGSVDWDAVRRSPVKRLFKAIESGGLAVVKSAKIKETLDMVYEENQTRRSALLAAAKEPSSSKATAVAPVGTQSESEEAKALEIARAEEDILSLDHLHSLPAQDAFFHLLRYPGIGVKTASCVSLFCLRHPSFAVDTHVFRHCQWLGWVPENATRDKTFMHCEVRIPQHLKYSLHQLFIQHGKKCGRCKARAGEGSEEWAKGCVIDHLVKRTHKEKSPVKKPSAKKRKTGEESEDDEEEEVEGDGDEEEEPVPAPPANKSKGKGKVPSLPLPRKKTPAAKGKVKGKKKAVTDREEGVDAGEPKAKKAKKEPPPVKKPAKKAATKGGKKK